MTFHSTPIAGAFLIELARREDIRGSFARVWSAAAFRQHGLIADVVEMNTSRSRKRGTVRGLHYQTAPHAEAKFVRCTRGALHDVVLDMRPDSPTYLRWAAFELRDSADRTLYVPPGCAHGFQTLENNTEITYAVTATYHPECERGIRWNDPAFRITWPISEVTLSDKDANLPLFNAKSPRIPNLVTV
jgi:dTDP-4-dehydrorhamnose 3,5-epimerase